MPRQRFINGQEIEVYEYGHWRPGVVYAGTAASSFGDYQIDGSYYVNVTIKGEFVWSRNDRRLIRPAETK
jgi:hypothetical protein